MRIALLCPIGEGGMVHYALQLSESLSKEFDVALFVPDECSATESPSGVDVIGIGISGLVSLMRNPFSLKRFIDTVERIEPDVVHVTSSHWLSVILCLFLRLKNYPLVVTLHDVRMHAGENGLLGRLVNLLYAGCGDHIIVHGEKLKRELIERGVKGSKISIASIGPFSVFAKCGNPSVKEENVILFFGRIEKYKGLEYLLEAKRILFEKGLNPKLVIAGRGDISRYSLDANSIGDVEILNRFIEDSEVAEIFLRSRIVVLPYSEASQSAVVPVAFSFRKALIVTDVGSLTELVEDGVNGLVVPPKNASLLSKAIEQLLSDDTLRKRLGEMGYKRVTEDDLWARNSEILRSVYESISPR
jgi:glycosyltransferase involved in cell wall biosynthesis